MKILWTEPSLDDLRAIRGYIAKDSETYAVSPGKRDQLIGGLVTPYG